MDMQEEIPLFARLLESTDEVTNIDAEEDYNILCIDVDGGDEEISNIREVIRENENWELKNCLSSDGVVYDLRCGQK